ncbi:putative membrane protein DUF2306 [Litoreibacter meonggei]|uniref:Putative membrane protein DUF2306 n=1 Tax=Litoreibacter meonggei TaxID=1049199 RepID=A0A497X5Y8_9RHOB|nr:DUF2306 domain-containing protein [Litoreibacter meonggei]RLJ60491.1 putative membrane protein DUF2306 [Litoreibacter meonggei]
MNTQTRREAGLFALICVYSFIPVIGGLIRLLELSGGPAIAPENLRALSNPIPISVHILSSALFCIGGALQFLPEFRRRHPKAHRVMGRYIAVSGLLSAMTGVWMTHFYLFPEDLQGNLLYWVRMVLGPTMIALIIFAVVAIRSRNVFLHSSFMLRAYVIGQGASTQAILGIFWIIITGAEATGPMRDFIMISAWGLNLAVGEMLIWTLLKPMWLRRQRRAV